MASESSQSAAAKRGVLVEQYLYRRETAKGPRFTINMRGLPTVRLALGTTITEARNVKRKMDQKRREENGRVIPGGPRLTIDQAAERTFELLQGEVDIGRFAPRTLHEIYQPRYEKYLRSKLGRTKLDELTPHDVRRLVQRLLKEGKVDKNGAKEPLAPYTVHGITTVLRTIYREARRAGWTTNDPFVGLDPRRDLASQKVKGEERPALRPDEIKKLLTEVSDYLLPLVTLIAFTGLRSSEALGLVWADVDFVDQKIKVKLQLGPDGTRLPLKTERSERTIEMAPEASQALLAQLERQEKEGLGNEADLVFMTPDGKPIARSTIRNAILRAAKRAGLGPTTTKDLRATFCHTMAEAGVPDSVAASQTGHSVQVYHDHYVKKQQAQAASKAAFETLRKHGYRLDDGLEDES